MDSRKVRSYYNSYSENYDNFYKKIQFEKYSHLLSININLSQPLVLDLGSGTGLLSTQLVAQIIGLDISYLMLQEGLRIGRPFLPVAADMAKIPFRKDSLSLILSITSVQNSENPELAIDEILRVAEKGSKAVLSILQKSKFLDNIISKIETLELPNKSFDLPPEDLGFILQF